MLYSELGSSRLHQLSVMHMRSGLVRYVISWSSSTLLDRLRAFVLRKEMGVEEDAGLLVPNLEGVF